MHDLVGGTLLLQIIANHSKDCAIAKNSQASFDDSTPSCVDHQYRVSSFSSKVNRFEIRPFVITGAFEPTILGCTTLTTHHIYDLRQESYPKIGKNISLNNDKAIFSQLSDRLRIEGLLEIYLHEANIYVRHALLGGKKNHSLDTHTSILGKTLNLSKESLWFKLCGLKGTCRSKMMWKGFYNPRSSISEGLIYSSMLRLTTFTFPPRIFGQMDFEQLIESRLVREQLRQFMETFSLRPTSQPPPTHDQDASKSNANELDDDHDVNV
ncbi:hypothetical protein Fmac_026916 [Flemingia macrophylla]|uniref:Uncharacterized protein n=1 Tax=Flemingia macrophylla TaxID=520843 RepID=A0ABD1LG94_9FABA